MRNQCVEDITGCLSVVDATVCLKLLFSFVSWREKKIWARVLVTSIKSDHECLMDIVVDFILPVSRRVEDLTLNYFFWINSVSHFFIQTSTKFLFKMLKKN
jgi:hypothetical protein